MNKIPIFVLTITVAIFFATSASSFGLLGDFDNDGDVDAEDLSVFSRNFGKKIVICIENEDCEPEYFCAKKDGGCGASGICEVKPEICTHDYDPVCGCDGTTYSNGCHAHGAGVNIAYKGPCISSQCDDGSGLICEMVPPNCSEFEILSLQDGCWICVNPATCKQWGEPGCSGEENCGAGMYCYYCGTSSCPDCDNCVPACVPDSV